MGVKMTQRVRRSSIPPEAGAGGLVMANSGRKRGRDGPESCRVVVVMWKCRTVVSEGCIA